MMVLAAEYNDKLGRKPGAIRVVAEKDKDFTSCCFENISDDDVNHPGGFVLILRRKMRMLTDDVNDRNNYTNGDNFNELILYKD